MKYISLISILLLSANVFAQSGCKMIRKTRNKNFTEGIVYGASVPTVDFYVVTYEKILNKNDTLKYPQYIISLVCASKYMLPDSILASVGDFELTFDDRSKIKWVGAKSENIPSLRVWNFELRLTEEQFNMLTKKKLISIKAFQLVETSIKKGSQITLINIANCLKTKK